MSSGRNWTKTTHSQKPKSGSKQWQKGSGKRPSSRRPGLYAFLLTITALAGLVVLVFALPYSPDRTPIFLLVESDYRSPWPLNGWAHEDAALFQLLDNEIVDVVAAESDFQSVEARLEVLEKRLAEHKSAIDARGVAIFYINCNCMVNDENQACIAFREQSAAHPENWLSLEKLFAVVDEQLSPQTHKVFFVDGLRTRTDWNLGTAFNTFPKALQTGVEKSPASNISVLTSASLGEQADVRSPFAKLITLGLAGDADGQISGIADGKISLYELSEFVSQEIAAWSQHNLGEIQTAALHTNQLQRDLPLSLSLSASDRNQIQASLIDATSQAPLLSDAELDLAWQKFESLAKGELRAIDPIRFSDLERQLLRLEEFALAGPTVQARARAEYDAVIQQMDLLVDLNSASLRTKWSAVGYDQRYFFNTLTPYSIAAGRYFDLISDVETNDISNQIARTRVTGDSAENIPVEAEAKAFRLSNLSEFRLAQMAAECDVNKFWESSNIVQQTLDLHQFCSRMSVPHGVEHPASLRAHRMLRGELSAIDRQRRDIEDSLLAGPGDSAPPADAIASLTTRLSQLESEMDDLNLAWNSSDRLNAELLYYLDWLADPRRDRDTDQSTLDLVALRNTAQELVELAQAINVYLSSDLVSPANRSEFLSNVQSATVQLESLHAALNSYAESLSRNPNVETALLSETASVLELPFLSVQYRSALRSKVRELQEKIHRTTTDAEQRQSQPSDLSHATEIANATVTWGPVWIEKLLGWQQESSSESIQTGDVQQRLVAFSRFLRKHQRFLARENSATWEIDKEDLFSNLRNAAQKIRASGPLWFEHTDRSLNAKMHFVLVQELLRDLANRAIDDCWGNAPNENSNNLYFQRLVDDYASAAQNLDLQERVSPIDFTSLKAQADEQAVFIRRGISLIATDKSMAPGMSPLQIEATLETIDIGQAPPDGNAVVYARDQHGQRRQLLNQTANTSNGKFPARLAFPPPVGSRKLSFGDPEQMAPPGPYDLVTLFRGNRFVAPFVALGGDGKRYEWNRSTIQDASVTVLGTQDVPPSLIFILDCSESMASNLPGETNQQSQRTKLDVAVGSLLRMLKELADSGRARVGVILFGHRMGWSTEPPLKILEQPKLTNSIPASLTPSTDVELILPLGRFDEFQLNKLAGHMESVVPWGQSPLYLAINTAIAEFQGKVDEKNSAIVVITDGLNYQFTPPNAARFTAAPISQSQILRELATAGTPVHVLGFAVEQDELAEAQVQFERISEATDGSFHTAGGENELMRLLRERVGNASFEVADARLLQAGQAWKASLNQPIEITKTSPAVEEFVVAFEDARADVKIEGGEALLMQFAPREGRFLPVPYTVDFPVQASMLAPEAGPDNDLIFRVHRPKKTDDGVELNVSIQSAVLPYTARPSECWLEVQPVSDSGASLGEPFVYYDCHWAPYAPVPVLSWKASDWPENSPKAEVRFWCKYAETPPQSVLKLTGLENPLRQAIPPAPLPEFPTVSVSVAIQNNFPSEGLFELQVIEIHQASSEGVGSLRVSLSGEEQLLKTIRYFDRKNGFASHRFQFPMEIQRPLLSELELQFTSKKDVVQNAYRLDAAEGIAADIFAKDELLPFNASDGPFRELEKSLIVPEVISSPDAAQ